MTPQPASTHTTLVPRIQNAQFGAALLTMQGNQTAAPNGGYRTRRERLLVTSTPQIGTPMEPARGSPSGSLNVAAGEVSDRP